MKILDLTNGNYGRLTVISRVGTNKNGNKTWLCRCACGGEAVISSASLVHNRTKSCGCLGPETTRRLKKGVPAPHSFKHGESKNKPEYHTWASMKQRCNDKNHRQYHNYGGRGIAVCDEWMTSYQAFLRDMGRKPTPSHSIDRINNDLGYFKDNCKWSNNFEQQNNRSNNCKVLFNDVVMTMSQLSRELNIPKTTLRRKVSGNKIAGASYFKASRAAS